MLWVKTFVRRCCLRFLLCHFVQPYLRGCQKLRLACLSAVIICLGIRVGKENGCFARNGWAACASLLPATTTGISRNDVCAATLRTRQLHKAPRVEHGHVTSSFESTIGPQARHERGEVVCRPHDERPSRVRGGVRGCIAAV